MVEPIDLEIHVDDTELEEAEEKLNAFEIRSHEVIHKTDKATTASFQQVVSMARGSYLLALGTVKAFGGSVSYMFRSMVSAAFSTIIALKAVSLAKAMTTMDWISFAMEMGQLGLATAATIAAELGAQDIGRSLMGAKMSLMGLSSLIGAINF